MAHDGITKLTRTQARTSGDTARAQEGDGKEVAPATDTIKAKLQIGYTPVVTMTTLKPFEKVRDFDTR